MPKHPCEDGLTPACFREYPKWYKQALAYKILHLLLPKQLTKKLPGLMGKPFIGPGAILPPGVIFPPGTIIPPYFTWPANWNPWLYFLFTNAFDPTTIFPEGWTPEDPLPEGVTISPGAVFPPNWTPKQPLPPGVVIPPKVIIPPGWTPKQPLPPGVVIPPEMVFPPDWTPEDPLPPGVIIKPEVIIPSDWTPEEPPPIPYIPNYPALPPEPGASPIPPIYVEPWQPGPITGPAGKITPPENIGTLQYQQGSTTASAIFGDLPDYTKIALVIITQLHVNVKAAYIKIGKIGNPTDTVNIEIWRAIPEFKPDYLVTGGTATPKGAASLPIFALDQPYVLIRFPNTPHLNLLTQYVLLFSRTGPVDPSNHYEVGWQIESPETYFSANAAGTWQVRHGGGLFDVKLYGSAG